MASPAAEDALLRQVLAVTLDPTAATTSGDVPVVYLAGLAQVRRARGRGARAVGAARDHARSAPHRTAPLRAPACMALRPPTPLFGWACPTARPRPAGAAGAPQPTPQPPPGPGSRSSRMRPRAEATAAAGVPS
jgi:hypothetical protein